MSEQLDEAQFAPVPISKIQSDSPLPADVYLKIAGKFIKFKNASDEINGEKYNYFISKNVKELFIQLGQVQQFMDWLRSENEKSVNEMVAEVGEENRDIVEKREALKEKVFETFAELELDSATVLILASQVKEFIEEVQRKQLPQAVLARLSKHNSSIADHSVNVANYSTFIAMVLGQGNTTILERVYMGALFHDYGKAKIPAEVLENSHNQKYNQAIQDHPIKGAKMIKELSKVHEHVITIIEQHHEQFNGKGFPLGISGDEIHGLSKIVQIANVFDNAVLENKGKPKKERYKTAIKVLEYDKGKQFDPEIVEKVTEALKLAYGEVYKASSKTENIDTSTVEDFSIEDLKTEVSDELDAELDELDSE